MSSYSHTKTGTVNVQTNPGLAARFFISRLPTIVHIKDHEGKDIYYILDKSVLIDYDYIKYVK